MSERIIHVADLTNITNALNNLGQGVQGVSRKIDNVDNEITVTRGELADLQQQFRDFELRYERATEVGLAETRLVKVRQKLEQDFGHHGEIRRAATGIVQAADVKIVREETVNTVTEELMIQAPGYWLGPALVALSCWMQNRKDVAERALAEALRRDDEKTSLFFALITRRAQRGEACGIWLDRYLGQQDPSLLKRQTMVLIDATAGGVFPADAQLRCHKRFQQWLDKLSEGDDFVENQRQQWRDALEFRIHSDDHTDKYPQLASHSSTWPVLSECLDRGALNENLLEYLKDIFEAPLPTPSRLIDAVDEQLDRLVTGYDAPELPLRKEEAKLEMIIREGGRRDEAEAKFALEEVALEERVDFTQMLTNAAMHSEKSGASVASQRLALALSREWLGDAFGDITLFTRQAVPEQIALSIDGWSGESTDGSEENALVSSLENHIAALEEDALEQVKLEAKHYVTGVIGLLLALMILGGNWIIALIGLALCGWVYSEYAGLEKRKDDVREMFEQRRESDVSTLKGSLSEVVEWRREFASLDDKSTPTREFISSIVPDSHLAAPQGGGRRISLDAA